MNENVRDQLIATAKDMLERFTQGPQAAADAPLQIPASEYTSEALFKSECQRLFRRVPLLAAATAEIPTPNSYKSMTLAGVPLLLVRGKDGVCRAFVNACTHRGSPLKQDCGRASRFTCPYHGWTFDTEGRLAGIASRECFGEIDRNTLGLVELALVEQFGLIWVSLDRDAGVDAKTLLGEFGPILGAFELENWHLHHRVELPGANWKLAFDAHLEFYHLPVLHRNTFGAGISNQAQYYFFGPHQRIALMSENPVDPQYAGFAKLAKTPEQDWDIESMLFGEWIFFPNVSINCFAAETRVIVISQVIPGDRHDRSTTIQTYLVEDDLGENVPPGVDEIVSFVQRVVETEDLPMSFSQQAALSSGTLKQVLLGQNEAGLQHHYHWRKKVLSAANQDAVTKLFGDT